MILLKFIHTKVILICYDSVHIMQKSEVHKMKKILLIALAILLTLTLTACDNSANPNSPQDNTPVTNPDNKDPANPPDNPDITGRTIVISKTEGNDVKMTRGEGREYDATSGTRMSDGYTALTGSASHISLLFDSESTVKTDELTNVEVEQISEKKLSLILLSGAIVADIASLQPDESIDFKAGNVTLGIRGTSFIMEYKNENEVIIIMLEGSGYINGDTLLEAGQIAIIGLHDILIQPLTYDGSLSDFALFEIGIRIDLPELGNGSLSHPPTDLPDGFHSYTFERYSERFGKNAVFIYEGYWKNGLPNGEGFYTFETINPEGIFLTNTIQGFFVNGLVHGTVTYISPENPGHALGGTFTFEADMGFPLQDTVETSHGTYNLVSVYGVPPWGHYSRNN